MSFFCRNCVWLLLTLTSFVTASENADGKHILFLEGSFNEEQLTIWSHFWVECLPCIESIIEDVNPVEGQVFAANYYQYTFNLSDGSCWVSDTYTSRRRYDWKPGDRILYVNISRERVLANIDLATNYGEYSYIHLSDCLRLTRVE